MKTIDADLKQLATIKYGGEDFHLTEVAYEDVEKINDAEDKAEATFELLASAGIPQRISKKLSLGTIKQLEELLVGDLKTEKK